MEYIVETKEQSSAFHSSQEPTWWEDIVMWGLIGPIGGIFLAVVGFLTLGLVVNWAEDQSQSLSNAVAPEEFDQEWFSWAYDHNFGLVYACNYAGGVFLKSDGHCHDSETIRIP